MKECTHDCSTCGDKDCGERSLHEKPHPQAKIKKVIGIVSGKGGVGKSLVTSLLAAKAAKLGKKTAILDADITGPSIPRAFGIKGGVSGDDTGIMPRITQSGIKIISSNLLLPDETDPVVWRGPIIANMVKQFWTEVNWGEVDYMFVDMPPGTGDVPLTVFQSIKVDGIIVVTSPQELVSMIVEKAVKMANMMKIKVIGIVENMSYVICPDCGKKINIFGEGKTEEVAKKFGVEVLAKLPFDANIASAVDKGELEKLDVNYLDKAIDKILI